MIIVEIMRTVDEEELQKTTKEKETKTKTSKGNRSYSGCELNDFVVHLSQVFSQLKCKASLIFKSNLELVLSIILKQRELYESKHVAVECRKRNMRLVILFDILLNRSFKMTTSFNNIARTTASTRRFIYQERFQIIWNWVFI